MGRDMGREGEGEGEKRGGEGAWGGRGRERTVRRSRKVHLENACDKELCMYVLVGLKFILFVVFFLALLLSTFELAKCLRFKRE
jgi:hypothetical protein